MQENLSINVIKYPLDYAVDINSAVYIYRIALDIISTDAKECFSFTTKGVFLHSFSLITRENSPFGPIYDDLGMPKMSKLWR